MKTKKILLSCTLLVCSLLHGADESPAARPARPNLLAGIQGFNKGGLKKTVTVSKEDNDTTQLLQEGPTSTTQATLSVVKPVAKMSMAEQLAAAGRARQARANANQDNPVATKTTAQTTPSQKIIRVATLSFKEFIPEVSKKDQLFDNLEELTKDMGEIIKLVEVQKEIEAEFTQGAITSLDQLRTKLKTSYKGTSLTHTAGKGQELYQSLQTRYFPVASSTKSTPRPISTASNKPTSPSQISDDVKAKVAEYIARPETLSQEQYDAWTDDIKRYFKKTYTSSCKEPADLRNLDNTIKEALQKTLTAARAQKQCPAPSTATTIPAPVERAVEQPKPGKLTAPAGFKLPASKTTNTDLNDGYLKILTNTAQQARQQDRDISLATALQKDLTALGISQDDAASYIAAVRKKLMSAADDNTDATAAATQQAARPKLNFLADIAARRQD